MCAKKMLKLCLICCFLCLVKFGLSSNGWAEAENNKKWSDEAELSFVQTGGNSDVTTLNGKNTLKCMVTETITGQWKAAALYGESDEEKQAERYTTELRGDHNFRNGFYYYLMAGWLRDQFAGLENRYYAGPGLGQKIEFATRHALSLEVGLNYAKEMSTDDTQNEFAEGRGFANYTFTINERLKFSEEVEYLRNLKEESDFWLNSTMALQTKFNDYLGLKVSYEVRYDNRPTPETNDTTDTLLSVALVINI